MGRGAVSKPNAVTGLLDLTPLISSSCFTNWPRRQRSAESLLGHFRRRGAFGDHLGEFNSAVSVQLSLQSSEQNEATMLLVLAAGTYDLRCARCARWNRRATWADAGRWSAFNARSQKCVRHSPSTVDVVHPNRPSRIGRDRHRGPAALVSHPYCSGLRRPAADTSLPLWRGAVGSKSCISERPHLAES